MIVSTDNKDSLPTSTGVYIFRDENNKALYIGKAINLRSRVSSYTEKELTNTRPHLVEMISKAKSIEVVETANEIEALVLEAALVKEKSPHYNILLKDDKSFSFIAIEKNVDYPKVLIIRESSDISRYKYKLFGPYPSGSTVRRIYKYLRYIYPFCNCKSIKDEKFYHGIGLCPGALQRVISIEEYKDRLTEIESFLSGKKKDTMKALQSEMMKYADSGNFEKAIVLRDRINDLQYINNKVRESSWRSPEQYIDLSKKRKKDRFNAIAEELGLSSIKRVECYDISTALGKNNYGAMTVMIDGELTPKEYRIFKIEDSIEPNDFKMLAEVITRRLKRLDISNDSTLPLDSSSTYNVNTELPVNKSKQSTEIPENDSLYQKPDIILIDGGVGQLTAIAHLVPESITIVGISKGRKYRRKGINKKDEFWILRNRKFKLAEQIDLKNGLLLSMLRDEAHRFSILHNRRSRLKKMSKSYLDEIKGVGPVNKNKIMHFYPDKGSLLNSIPTDLAKIITNKRVLQIISDYISSNKE